MADESEKLERLRIDIARLMTSEREMCFFVANSTNVEQVLIVSGEVQNLRSRLDDMREEFGQLLDLQNKRIRREQRMLRRRELQAPIAPVRFFGIQEVPAS